MELIKIVGAFPALRKLAAADLPVKKLYWVRKMVNAVQPEYTFFDEKRKELIEKYCDVSNLNAIRPFDGMAEKFDADMKELLALEVAVDFKEVEISDAEDIRLSLNDLESLDGFVKILFTEEK